jgi:hypothetical protein
MAKHRAAQLDPARRRAVLMGALVAVVLAAGVAFPRWYWLPQGEAMRRAADYMALARPGLPYERVTAWRRWTGAWAVEFGSEPPARLEVDRDGLCEER